jgi:hypothetical protein
MLRTTSFIRFTTRLALLLPIAVLGAACGDDESSEATGDAGTGAETGAGKDAASGGDSSTGDGGGGADGAVVTPDTMAPTIVASDPGAPGAAGAGVSPNAQVTVTFSEAMAGLSITSGTTLTVTLAGVAVAGSVAYADSVATFTPTAPFLLDTTYTVTMTTAATDVAGNPLAAPYTWTFKTDATLPAGPSPVALGAAGNYVVLAKSEITNVPTSKITGNVAISPAAASYITGFSMTKAGTYWTSAQVTGKLFAADNDAPTPSNLTTAVSNMEAAYTDAAGRPAPPVGPFLDLGAGNIGGKTLAPGLYRWTSTVTIPDDVVLAGAANDVWIFQITGNVMMSASKAITFTGGARAKNVFWQVAGFVDLGTSAHAEGVILSKTLIKLGTGASINGRLLAQTAVNLAGNTIVKPAP